MAQDGRGEQSALDDGIQDTRGSQPALDEGKDSEESSEDELIIETGEEIPEDFLNWAREMATGHWRRK